MDNIKSMTEMAKANNIEMILCSLVPANSFPWRPEIITQKVIQLNQMIKTYAEENKLYYVTITLPWSMSLMAATTPWV